MRIVLIALVIAGCAGRPLRGEGRSTELATALAAAITAHDAPAAAALYAPDATVSLMGDARTQRGRAQIESALAALFDRYPGMALTVGRSWVDASASVIEVVVTGSRGANRFGAVGVLILILDGNGLIATQRVYLDVPTVRGQLDPSSLPEGAKVRAVATAPPAGRQTLSAQGTPTERANLEATDRIWQRLDAHDPAGTLAPSSDDYIYDDFSGPAPLGKAATQELVAGFLKLVSDFKITSMPVHFAAGDDVITESVEQMTFRGRAVTLRALDVKRFAGGKVVREWQYANGAEVLAQLFGVEALEDP